MGVAVPSAAPYRYRQSSNDRCGLREPVLRMLAHVPISRNNAFYYGVHDRDSFPFPFENNRDPSSKLLAVLRAGEPYKGVEVAATHAAPAAGFVTLQYVPLKGER